MASSKRRRQAAKTMAPLIKKHCFISSASNVGLSVLREALAENGYDAIVPSDLDTSRRDRSELLREHLRRAELVVGIIPAGAAENVCYEVGLAYGLGKRVLLVVSPDRRELPFDLLSVVVVRTAPDNRAALSFAIEQIAQAPPPRVRAATTESALSTPPTKAVSDWLGRLAELQDAPDASEGQSRLGAFHARRGFALEDLVGDILREMVGVDIVAEGPHPTRGWDFVLWSDRLEPFVGNPLAVEVKLKLPRGRSALQQLADRILSSLRGSNTIYVLLLYLDGPEPGLVWQVLPANVLPLQLKSLIQALRNRSFEEVVRDLRNQRVHGVGR